MSTNSSSEANVITIDVLKPYDLLYNGQYRYLDVRTEEEFKNGHVSVGDVLNVPSMIDTPEGRVKNPDFLEEVLQVSTKDDYPIVGCQGGGRSLNATIDLVDAGFKNVYNMGGGYLAWVQNGLPVAVVTDDPQTGPLSQ
ncbi:thiosulfate sulfurtransferase 18-like [Bidens hawaiensis]|uniref:thiosulfate sulfurtransferase 18-like n=1 Tax=Bidens hawaiensis TaxID=980011 RepID=UPI004049D356